MAGPPIAIHLDENAKPRACHTAAPIPLHWQQCVKEDLIRDEALSVIEKVAYGEPVSWCHRMVVTRKSDGTPRRSVDLSPLNKHCRHETFSGESPFVLARRVEGKTWKTGSRMRGMVITVHLFACPTGIQCCIIFPRVSKSSCFTTPTRCNGVKLH